MEPAGEITTEIWNCNWKAAVENNLENYHIPLGHPGYDRLLDNDLMDFSNANGVSGSRSVLKDEPSSNPTERLYQRLAPEVLTDLPEKTRRTWLFFAMLPNTGVDVYPDCMDVFQSCRARRPPAPCAIPSMPRPTSAARRAFCATSTIASTARSAPRTRA